MADNPNPDRKAKTWLRIALILLLLVIALLLWLWLRRPPPPPPKPKVFQPPIEKYEDIAKYTQGTPLPKERDAVIPAKVNDHIRGALNTPLSMIEYGNVDGSYTKVIHPKLVTMVTKYAGKLNWIFRHYPKASSDAAHLTGEAAECVADQLGKGDRFSKEGNAAFFKFLDLAMATQALTSDAVYGMAAEVGADVEKVRTCVEDETFKIEVLKDKYDAKRDAGVRVMPTFFFINNTTGKSRVVEGVNTAEYFSAIVDIMKP
jgi:protein-disulfide isomerase